MKYRQIQIAGDVALIEEWEFDTLEEYFDFQFEMEQREPEPEDSGNSNKGYH